MFVKRKITSCLSLLVLAACATPATQDAEPAAPRVPNPVMVQKIEEKKVQPVATDFPVLSQMPSEAPPRFPSKEVEQFKDGLVETRDGLYGDVARDTARANKDREIPVTITEKGRKTRRALDEAGAVLGTRIQDDQNAATKLRGESVPKLGGLPPKAERENAPQQQENTSDDQ